MDARFKPASPNHDQAKNTSASMLVLLGAGGARGACAEGGESLIRWLVH